MKALINMATVILRDPEATEEVARVIRRYDTNLLQLANEVQQLREEVESCGWVVETITIEAYRALEVAK